MSILAFEVQLSECYCLPLQQKVKLPDAPLVFAGAFGGPFGIFIFTPLRNALTLASQNSIATAGELYLDVFAGGFASGWTGGMACVLPSSPQFIVMGPLFHLLKELLNSAVLAVVCCAIAESCISYSSQTLNAQMAFNADQELAGSKDQVELWNPFVPIGPGSSVHMLRNFVALSGLRVFSRPCQDVLAKAANFLGLQLPQGPQEFFGDFIASMGAAMLQVPCFEILSAPLNQLYNFSVTSNEFMGSGFVDKLILSRAYLVQTYLVFDLEGHVVSVSPTLCRDLFMRCAYIANLYALFGLIERLAVALWRRCHRSRLSN
ncbi:unnamed protein product [Durusdinium trenchii]|uniref:Uncharacterized protein n=1 Tax=Durusdinium trenchii TaxID=1381693 RepID=A0ABP0MLA2_9DINO